jgi:hypothetical protein
MMHTVSADNQGERAKGASLEVTAHLSGWDLESLYAAKYADMVRLAATRSPAHTRLHHPRRLLAGDTKHTGQHLGAAQLSEAMVVGWRE